MTNAMYAPLTADEKAAAPYSLRSGRAGQGLSADHLLRPRHVAWEVVEDARKVARGEVEEPSVLPIIFEAGRDDDWRDEDVWHRVNPGLKHGYPSLDGLRRHANRAARSIDERQSLRQLKLNIWLDAATDPFVDMDLYDLGKKPLDLDALEKDPCWLGVDLSSTTDLTVIVACWRTADGYAVHPWFFCPTDNLQEREDESGAPYVHWATTSDAIVNVVKQAVGAGEGLKLRLAPLIAALNGDVRKNLSSKIWQHLSSIKKPETLVSALGIIPDTMNENSSQSLERLLNSVFTQAVSSNDIKAIAWVTSVIQNRKSEIAGAAAAAGEFRSRVSGLIRSRGLPKGLRPELKKLADTLPNGRRGRKTSATQSA